GLEGAAADVRAAGGTPLVVPVDVADADAMEAAVGRIEDELGPIDAWVSGAMASVQAPTLDLTAEERRRVTEVTYLGALNGIVPVVRRMVERDRGHVVQIGSALGVRAAPPLALYSGAKHAVRGFLDALRAELRREGSAVRITLVLPPGMNTTHFGWARTRTPGAGRPFPPA
ncbi:SDR family NAD(P)-dependent oxidoreductase, partial [Patulibacter sp. S7RM1-6]